MKWTRLQTFLIVAQEGSFSKASRRLGLSQSAISRQVTVLEEELKCQVFNRHWSGLVLTEAGEELYSTTTEMARELDLSIAKINEQKSLPEGPLKVSTTVAFGSAWLTPRINDFQRQHPRIALSLHLADNNYLDLSMRDADCAIRFTRQTEHSLVQTPLGFVRYRIYASREYLERAAPLERIEDLDNHALIVYGDYAPQPIGEMNWLLSVGRIAIDPRPASLTINSVYGIFRAAEAGLGVAALPYYLASRSDMLVEVLPGQLGPAFEVLFVYPEELRQSRRIRVFLDFLRAQADDDIAAGHLSKRL
ncbi:MAG: LysR family transcriptional regulator [Rhizobiales bacterium]|nr:LysR family transcriptional regulator [Hyphomicrobiales bacterium]